MPGPVAVIAAEHRGGLPILFQDNQWSASLKLSGVAPLYARPVTALPTRRSMSATHRTNAMPGFGASSESSLTGTGRVHIARPFILPAFSSRRQPEGHGGPRSVTVLHHPESAERIIGLAIEGHRHSGPGLLQSFYAAALCGSGAGSVRAFLDGAKPAFRRYAAANLCRFGFRAGILVDESVILEINAMPALPPSGSPMT